MGENAFDGFIGIGRSFMAGIERGDENAMRFKRLLGVIDTLLADTHSMVVEELSKVERAESEQDARRSIDSLRQAPLSRSFHAEGLCDSLVGLGYALRELTDRAPQSESLPEEKRDQLRRFAGMLTDREQELAGRYGWEIAELRSLLDAPARGVALAVIREQAQAAKRRLTDQMADFRALGDRFQKLSRG